MTFIQEHWRKQIKKQQKNNKKQRVTPSETSKGVQIPCRFLTQFNTRKHKKQGSKWVQNKTKHWKSKTRNKQTNKNKQQQQVLPVLILGVVFYTLSPSFLVLQMKPCFSFGCLYQSLYDSWSQQVCLLLEFWEFFRYEVAFSAVLLHLLHPYSLPLPCQVLK